AGFTLLMGTRVALASPKLDISPPRIQQAPSEIFYRRTFVISSPDAPEVVKVGLLSVNIVGGGNRSATLTIVGRTPTTLTVEAPGERSRGRRRPRWLDPRARFVRSVQSRGSEAGSWCCCWRPSSGSGGCSGPDVKSAKGGLAPPLGSTEADRVLRA